ncbi:MAG: AraC family transcriptional regulator, partial [Clostridiales bacterium]|nr:AraC family transcriptional regulator [Clostridiales bacterium]
MKKLYEATYEFFREVHPAPLWFARAEDCAPHFHHQMEILYVAGGAAAARINGEERGLAEGSLCVSDSYDIHSYRMGPDCEAYVVIAPKEYFPEYDTLVKNKLLDGRFYAGADAARTVGPLIALMREFWPQGGELYCKGLAAAVLGWVAETLPYKKTSENEKIRNVRDILSYIHGHLDGDVGLKSLAKRFGYTPTHFSHLFNDATGFHLREFVNTLRAQRAAARLKAGNPVLSVALDCGFENIRTFYRAFTKVYGVAPGKYA